MAETYAEVEARIQRAINVIRSGIGANVAVAAREYDVSEYRLRGRWKNRPSKMDRPASNRKLSDAEELAICQYLDRLDQIGTSVRYSMIENCANFLLKCNHQDLTTSPPTVSAKWPQRFLERHPEYQKKKQKTLDMHRKNAHDPEALEHGWRSLGRSMSKREYNQVTFIIWMRRDFVLA